MMWLLAFQVFQAQVELLNSFKIGIPCYRDGEKKIQENTNVEQ